MRSSTNITTLKSGVTELMGSLEKQKKDMSKSNVRRITTQLAKVVADMQDIKGSLKRSN